MEETKTVNMRVRKDSNSGKVAGSIAGLIRAGHIAKIETVGAASTYQAVCAIDIAQDFIRSDGYTVQVAIRINKRTFPDGEQRNCVIFTLTGTKE